MLTPIKFINTEGRYNKWLFKCDCGNEIIKNMENVLRSHTKSCGCLLNKGNLKHGLSNTRFYSIWAGIKNRCFCKGWETYKKYGGCGITVCNEWSKFENFKNNMYKEYLEHVNKYGEKNTTIDRIDSKGDYRKDNCRWATYEKQANNIKTNIFYEYKGERKTIREWEKKYNIKRGTLWARLRTSKMQFETAINK